MCAVSSWDTPGLPWPRGALPRGHLFGKELSAFINEIRTQAGMTQTELAAALDTTQPAVWKLENARHMPSLGMLIRIAEATRTPMTLTAKLRYKGLYPGTLQLWPLPPEPHGPPGNRTFGDDPDAEGFVVPAAFRLPRDTPGGIVDGRYRPESG